MISHLDQQDAPGKMADTLRLWKDIRTNKYDIVISDIVLYEIGKCAKSKLDRLKAFIDEIKYVYVEQNKEEERLCQLYLDIGGVPPDSALDAMHIAIATVNNCNAILSWNFKHIVNLRAMTAVEAVNLSEGYSPLRLLTPANILGKEAIS